MHSPQLSDLNNGTSKETQALLRQHHQLQFHQQHSDYSLDSQEISLNIQNFIDAQLNEDFFPEILQNQSKHINNLQSKPVGSNYNNNNFHKTLAYMPQPVHSSVTYSPQVSPCSESNSSFSSDSPRIKEEPIDFDFFNTFNNCPQFTRSDNSFITMAPNPLQQRQKSPLNSLRKFGKNIDKESEEYKNKRIRNNIAVRKSREKANIKKRETEEKYKLLLRDHDQLKKESDFLKEEVTLYRTFFNSLGIPREQLRELSRQHQSIQLPQQLTL